MALHAFVSVGDTRPFHFFRPVRHSSIHVHCVGREFTGDIHGKRDNGSGGGVTLRRREPEPGQDGLCGRFTRTRQESNHSP